MRTAVDRRVDNLALAYQELLTVIVRLRTGRYPIQNATSFRAQIREGLEAARNTARPANYSEEDIRVTTFAVVGFLDESILNRNPDFAEWVRRPLQQELFGVLTAGEIFFRNIDYLLNRPDSQELADVLEVYEFCLLLGFHGRYGETEDASLRAIAARLNDRIRRIRGQSWPVSPPWGPVQVTTVNRDRSLRRVSWIAVTIWILALCSFFAYTFVLRSSSAQLTDAISSVPY